MRILEGLERKVWGRPGNAELANNHHRVSVTGSAPAPPRPAPSQSSTWYLFNQPGVELFKKLVYLACLPVEAENRLAGEIAIVGAEVLASVDDVSMISSIVEKSRATCECEGSASCRPRKRGRERERRRKYRLNTTLATRPERPAPERPAQRMNFATPLMVQATSPSLRRRGEER